MKELTSKQKQMLEMLKRGYSNLEEHTIEDLQAIKLYVRNNEPYYERNKKCIFCGKSAWRNKYCNWENSCRSGTQCHHYGENLVDKIRKRIKTKQTNIKKCRQCNKEFNSERSSAKFCNSNCRLKFHRNNKGIKLYNWLRELKPLDAINLGKYEIIKTPYGNMYKKPELW